MNLSVLDFGVSSHLKGFNHGLEKTVELAQFCETIACKRYWLAEHFGRYQYWHQIEPVLSILAGLTENIRIGAGGVLIKHRSVLLTMSNFIFLNSAYDNRIDLGLTAGGVMKDLKGLIEIEKDYKDQMEAVLSYQKDETIEQLGFVNNNIPQLWVLGSGGFSYTIAENNALEYCFSSFHQVTNYEIRKKSFLEELRLSNGTKKTSLAIAGISTRKYKEQAELFSKNTGVASIIADNDIEFLQHIDALIKEFQPTELFFLPTCDDTEECKRNINLLKNHIT